MLFDRGLTKAARSVSAGVGQRLTLESSEGWLTGDNVALSQDKAMKVSTVNRCVEVLSNSMAVLPVYLMEEHTKQRLTEHRLGKVLWGRANEAMTSFDYEKLMECNRLLRGNAYAWICRSPKTGYPVELIPLPPDCVTPHVAPDGRLWYAFAHPQTGLNWLHSADVLHYKAYSEDGITGVSVLHRASRTISTARAALEYENSMYENGGHPSGVLTAEADLSGDTSVKGADGNDIKIGKKEYLRREWERMHSGPGNSFRIAVLDLGLKYQPIAMSNSDAQFVESKDLRVADVCRFFGVPLHLAFAGKQSYSSNEQNSIEYVRYTLQAGVTQREQEDTYKLLLPGEREQGQRVKRELKVFLRGDTASQAAWYKAMREIGVYSVDDIRALEDSPEVPGGSSRYASWNYGPLELFETLSVLRALGGKKEEKDG